tara:strand:- start:377 stop:550 length:174 start_codon:yes stop_codon:yes gene_type:complete
MLFAGLAVEAAWSHIVRVGMATTTAVALAVAMWRVLKAFRAAATREAQARLAQGLRH